MAKKSYNPFLMFGSYIGAIVFYIFAVIHLLIKIIQNQAQLNLDLNLFNVLIGVFGINLLNPDMPIFVASAFFTGMGFIVSGFIVGYCIHALVRAIRK